MKRTIATLVAATLLMGASPQTLTIDVSHEKLSDVVQMLSAQSGRNITVAEAPSGQLVTLHLRDVTVDQALQALEDTYGLVQVQRSNFTVLLGKSDAGSLGANVSSTSVRTPNGQAAAYLALVNKMVPSVAAQLVDASTLVLAGRPEDLARAQNLVSESGHGPTYRSIPVSYDSPSNVIARLKSMNLVEQTTMVAANDEAGTIVVSGNASSVDALVKAVAALDVPPRRGETEVRVLEMQPYNDSTHRGVVWGQPVSLTASGQNGSAQTQIIVQQGQAVTAFTNGSIPIAAQINQLVAAGHAKVLANPTQAFNSTKPSVFNFGENYPIVVTNASTFVGGTNVQFYPIGIQLSVQPIIGANGQMTVTIQAQDNTIVSFEPINHIPIVGTRSTQGTITIYQGESIVLSGFLQDDDTDTLTKVPFFGDIPVLGELFRDRQTTHQRVELTFVITPKLVENYKDESSH